MCSSKLFLPQVAGILKPSITFSLLPLLPLPPSLLPLAPSLLPPCSPCSFSPPGYSPCSPACSLTPSPFALTEVMGTLKPSITYASLPSSLPHPSLPSSLPLALCSPACSPSLPSSLPLPLASHSPCFSLPLSPCSLDYHLTPCPHTGSGDPKT